MKRKYTDITEEQIIDIKMIDPYVNNKELCTILNMCQNTIIKLRKHIGLEKRKNGRPFGTTYMDMITYKYPKDIQTTIDRLTKQFN